MSDFTPGPFSVAETRHKYDIVIRGPKNEPVALVLIAGFSKKEGVANANLLAASPDLLESLRLMVDLVELAVPFEGDTIRMARAAIAKATGEQP